MPDGMYFKLQIVLNKADSLDLGLLGRGHFHRGSKGHHLHILTLQIPVMDIFEVEIDRQ
jgi:hypothetical protein